MDIAQSVKKNGILIRSSNKNTRTIKIEEMMKLNVDSRG